VEFIIVCPLDFTIDSSLWVFWFYWYRRPAFYEELVGKRKGELEGINIIWFQWPSKTRQWLGKTEAEAGKLK